jgi:hypothetical protein
MKGWLVAAAALVALTTAALAQSGGWYVLYSADRQCSVTNQIIRGMGKLGGPYGSKAAATAAKERMAVCDKVNTDPSPGDSGSAR